jgi:hypothetical protein
VAVSLSILADALTTRWMLNYSAALDYSKIITVAETAPTPRGASDDRRR